MKVMSPECDCPAGLPVGPSMATLCGGSTLFLFMAILEGFIRKQCDIADPCGRAGLRFRDDPDDEYDFIVVGGGSSGSVVASRLSEKKQWKVLLIEAGGDEPVATQIPAMFMDSIGSDLDWKYYTEQEKHACLASAGRRCFWPRGKVLGGTSVFNGMMYIRGNPEDYDKWEALGNPGWSYKDVLPFFLKSENNLEINEMGSELHAQGGLLPVTRFPYNPPMAYDLLKGGEELGLKVQDLNGRNSTGIMIAQTTSKRGSRYSTARAFLRPARKRSNLHILLNTTVTKILISPDKKIAYGVEYFHKLGQKRRIRAKKEVIVSGGAVNSPQILLLSGVGPKADLEKVGVPVIHNLTGVGKNLQNHISFALNFFANESDTNPLDWATAMEYVLNRNGSMSGTGISDVTLKYASKYADKPGVPDTQFFFGGYLANCAATGRVGELKSNTSRSIQIIPVTLHPKSRGYITLASSNARAQPRIFANYLTDQRDILVLVEGIKFALKLHKTEALKKYGLRLDSRRVKGCEKFSLTSSKYWICAIKQNTGPENHQAGSCKMGPERDPLAVVDHELRVRGIRGLRVMDTSIMPEVTSGNTNAPAIMIAEKGAEMVKCAWSKKRSKKRRSMKRRTSYKC